ncbi:MAG: tetratricopeptide repeat protein [Pseudomonadota bacterium]
MLKNKSLLAVLIFAAVASVGNGYVAFAENDTSSIALNDDPQEKKVETQTLENSDNEPSEVGVSGSYLSSLFSRSNGDIESAIKSLKTVYHKNPQDTDVANQLMGLYLLAGHIDKAMEIATHVYKNNNNKDPISALMLSLKSIKNNDVDGAARILDKLSEEESGQLWLPLISAWLDIEKNQLKKPLMMEELSAEVGRAAPVVSYHLALINAQAGFTKAAIENFKYSVEDQSNPPARVMDRLKKFYAKNNSPEGLKPIVTKYREPEGNLPEMNLEEINNMQAGAAEILLTMGSLMLAADVTQDATLYLQLALYLKPEMDVAIVTLAQAYSELQQYGIANELLAKIQANNPLYNDAQLYIAINLGRLHKIEESVAKLDSLISAFPNNTDAYIAKGDLLRTQENYADAIKVYDAALGVVKEKKARHWPIYFALGICYDKIGNWVEAENKLRYSMKLSPDQPDVLNYLGYSFLIRGENFAEARMLIEKAIAKRPSDPQIMDSMGLALYLAGDYKQAAMYLERAVSLLPADVTVNEHLGDLYWRMGRKNEARFQWDRSLTYSKEDSVIQEIKEKIKYGLPEKTIAVTDKNQINVIKKTNIVEKQDNVDPANATVTE